MGTATFVIPFIAVAASLMASAASNPDVLAKLPLSFEENRGQASKPVKFLARGAGYTLFLTPSEAVLSLQRPGADRATLVRSRLVGANPRPHVEAVEPLPGRGNYFAGTDRTNWITDIPTFEKVRYSQVYPGIDLLYYGRQGRLEYDFVVAPGADPGAIQLAFTGIRRLRLDAAGDLLLETGPDQIRWHRPVIYQLANGVRKPVQGAFIIKGRRQVGFKVSAYDARLPLVIDPVLTYATYYGGSKNEKARGFAVDSAGNAYFAGYTTSTNLPGVSTGYQKTYGGQENNLFVTGDAFVAKLNPAGTALLYASYLGGTASDLGLAMAIDGSGNAYVTGYTRSTNFPTTTGAFQRTYQGAGGNTWNVGGDAFVTKLNPAGNALVYSTYVGGSKDDRGTAITVDSAGNAYLAGITMSTNLPVTAGAFQRTYGGEGGMPIHPHVPTQVMVFGDAFVAKVNPTGTALSFCTYLGGSQDDSVNAIALDAESNIYVAGGTLSTNFPVTAGVYQSKFAGYGTPGQDIFRLGDGFLTKLRADGSGLLASTYLGGSRDDSIMGLALGSTGDVYAAGFTVSTNFPTTPGAYQTTYRGGTAGNINELIFGDAFVARLNANLSALVFSTYFGGTLDDAGWAVAVDPAGNAYVVGHTQSRDLPVTADALQKVFGGEGGDAIQVFGDPFLAGVSADGKRLLYATYLGGNRDDGAVAIVLDNAGSAYIAGGTYSTNYPVTPGASQRIFGGGTSDYGYPPGDAFLAKVGQLFQTGPSFTLPGIGNAANYVAGKVSPGELIVIFGKDFGPAALAGLLLTNGMVTTETGETRVLFDGVAAPMVYAANGQISCVVPYEVAGKTTTQVVVEYKKMKGAAVAVPVVEAVPGLFSINSSGTGPGAFLNEDNSVNSAANPLERGKIAIFYGTGEGQTTPGGVSGLPATTVFPKPVLPVTVTIGGKSAEVLYYGAAPYMVAGVIQINARAPMDIPAGNAEVIMKSGNNTSQTGVTLAVK
jgi:uncharacterized protein (TIGR03437 family)